MNESLKQDKGEKPSNGGEYAFNTKNTNLWYDGIEKQLQREAESVKYQDIPKLSNDTVFEVGQKKSELLTERELAHDAYIYDKGTDDYYLRSDDEGS